MAAAEVPDLTNIYSKSWYVDVKKDHPKDYDPDTVKALIPEGTPAVDGLGSLDKEALFTEILGYEYSSFQNQSPEIEGNIKVSGTGLEYDYKVFSRNEDAPKNIAKYLSDLEKNIVCFTDTARDGYALIANWPYEDLDGPNIFHAHTRESENDPAGKMNVPSAPKELAKAFENRFFYEKNKTNDVGLLYPASQLNPSNNKDKLADFYSKFSVDLVLNGIKDNKKKTLRVTLHLRDFPMKGDRTAIEGDINKAGYFQKFVNAVKNAFAIEEEIKNKKKEIFLSKYHGDIAQVLSAHRNIVLTSYDSKTEVQTKDLYKAFQSYDINTCVRALLEGVDIVFMHTSKKDPQTIIVFRNSILKNQDLILKSFLENLITIMNNYINKYNLYKSNIVAKNKQRKVFLEGFNNFYITTIGKINALKQPVLPDGTTPPTPTDAINNLYAEVIKEGLRFSANAYLIPSEDYKEEIPSIDSETINLLKKYTGEEKPIIENLRRDLDVINNYYEKLMKNFKIPDDFNSDNLIETATVKLRPVLLEKEFVFGEGKPLTLEDSLKLINLTYGPSERDRFTSFAPKLISCFAADKILSIHPKLKRFEDINKKSFAYQFLELLSKIAELNPITDLKFKNCLKLIGLESPIPVFNGGRRRMTRKRGGGRGYTGVHTITFQKKPAQGKTYSTKSFLQKKPSLSSTRKAPRLTKSALGLTEEQKAKVRNAAIKRRQVAMREREREEEEEEFDSYVPMLEDFINDSKKYFELIKNILQEKSKENIEKLIVDYGNKKLNDVALSGGAGAGEKRGRNENEENEMEVVNENEVTPTVKRRRREEEILLSICPINVIYDILNEMVETLERLLNLRPSKERSEKINKLNEEIQSLLNNDFIAEIQENELESYYSSEPAPVAVVAAAPVPMPVPIAVEAAAPVPFAVVAAASVPPNNDNNQEGGQRKKNRKTHKIRRNRKN